MTQNLSLSTIQNLIFTIRGKAVMLDSDLAKLYKVSTGRLNEAVKRNIKRFPDDFMFQLSIDEFNHLKSQFAISNTHGGRRRLPQVFTEQGIAMLSGVLNSDTAIDININIMRAFVQMRRMSLSVVDLRNKVNKLEKKYNNQFRTIFNALQQIFDPPPIKKKNKKIGFYKE